MAFYIKTSTLSLRALRTNPLHNLTFRTITTAPAQTHKQTQSSFEPKTLEQRQRIETLERQILSPERAETSYSGTDNAVGDDNFAYDPSITAPEGEFRCFEDEVRVDGEADPLFISPANRDFSQLLDRDLDGRAVGRDKGDRLGAGGSVRGWVNKAKEVRIKGGRFKGGMDEYERLLTGLRRLQMRDKGVPGKEGGERGSEKGT